MTSAEGLTETCVTALRLLVQSNLNTLELLILRQNSKNAKEGILG